MSSGVTFWWQNTSRPDRWGPGIAGTATSRGCVGPPGKSSSVAARVTTAATASSEAAAGRKQPAHVASTWPRARRHEHQWRAVALAVVIRDEPHGGIPVVALASGAEAGHLQPIAEESERRTDRAGRRRAPSHFDVANAGGAEPAPSLPAGRFFGSVQISGEWRLAFEALAVG